MTVREVVPASPASKSDALKKSLIKTLYTDPTSPRPYQPPSNMHLCSVQLTGSMLNAEHGYVCHLTRWFSSEQQHEQYWSRLPATMPLV